ncbi:hypothetical protein [Oceanithermus sp.]
MLIRFVASSFETLIEVAMWLVLLIGAIQGYALGRGSLIGALVGVVLALIFDVVVFGTLVVLLDIRNELKKLGRTPPVA